MTLARRSVKGGEAILLDADTLPQTIGVVTTRADALGIEVVVASKPLAHAVEEIDVFAVVVQTPGASGRLASTEELRTIADRAHASGAMVIAACDLMALTLTTPPGSTAVTMPSPSVPWRTASPVDRSGLSPRGWIRATGAP